MSDPFVGQIMAVPYTYAPDQWAFCQGQTIAIQQNTALFALLGTNFGGNGTVNFMLPDLRGRFVVGAGQPNNIAGLGNLELGDMGGLAQTTLNSAQTPLQAHVHPATFTGTGGGGTGPLSASGNVSLGLSGGSFSANVSVTGDLEATTGAATQSMPQQGWPTGDTAGMPIYADPSTGTAIQMAKITCDGTVSGPLTGNASGTVSIPVTGATGITGGTVTVQPAGAAATIPVPTMSPYLVLNNIIAMYGIFPPRG